MAGRSPDYWPVPTLVGQNDAEGMIVLVPDIITNGKANPPGTSQAGDWVAGDCSDSTRSPSAEMTPSPRNLALLRQDFERVVPVELGLARGSVESRLVADMMRRHYFPGEALSEDGKSSFVKVRAMDRLGINQVQVSGSAWHVGYRLGPQHTGVEPVAYP